MFNFVPFKGQVCFSSDINCKRNFACKRQIFAHHCRWSELAVITTCLTLEPLESHESCNTGVLQSKTMYSFQPVVDCDIAYFHGLHFTFVAQVSAPVPLLLLTLEPIMASPSGRCGLYFGLTPAE